VEGFPDGAAEADGRVCALAGTEGGDPTRACGEEGEYGGAVVESGGYGYQRGEMCLLQLRVGEQVMLIREKVNGWPDNVYAPSAVRYSEKLPHPKEMSKGDIDNLKNAWVAGAKRAVTCGFDVIEIHNAQ